MKNPLNFNPPLPDASADLASRVAETRDELNALTPLEYATLPEKVATLADAFDRAVDELADFLRIAGDGAAADTIANWRTRSKGGAPVDASLVAHEATLQPGAAVRILAGPPAGNLGTVEGEATSGTRCWFVRDAANGIRWIVPSKHLVVIS